MFGMIDWTTVKKEAVEEMEAERRDALLRSNALDRMELDDIGCIGLRTVKQEVEVSLCYSILSLTSFMKLTHSRRPRAVSMKYSITMCLPIFENAFSLISYFIRLLNDYLHIFLFVEFVGR